MVKRIGQLHDPVLMISADATDAQRLVYILCSNRPVKYKTGRSKIVYIGMSRKGISRLAESASEKIEEGFDLLWGLKRLDGYVVWPQNRAGRPIGGKSPQNSLESDFLKVFIDIHGERPKLNGSGQGIKHISGAYGTQWVEDIIRQYS